MSDKLSEQMQEVIDLYNNDPELALDPIWVHYQDEVAALETRLEALKRQLRDVRGLIEFHIRNRNRYGTTWDVLQAIKMAAALEDQPDE